MISRKPSSTPLSVPPAHEQCHALNSSRARQRSISQRWDATIWLAHGPVRGFPDKMPGNYLYGGIIRRAFPNAKIVHLTRHPLAVCYAIYKTLFRDGYPFSYDLGDIGRYYAGYRKLMDHWRTTLPGFV